MEYIQEIINQVINNFDWAYVLSVNILSYIIITIVNNFNKKVSSSWKKLITICVTIILAITYYVIDNTDLKIIINSSILAPVAWDWIIKPIFNKFGIDYKKENKEND